MPAEWSWVVPPGLSVLVIGILVWVNFGRPYFRKKQLRYPISAWFTDPATGASKLKEVRLPSNSESIIHLRIRHHYKYEEAQLCIGFSGDLNKCPIPISYIDAYIAKGKNRHASPETHDNHYIDVKHRYHIHSSRLRTPSDTRTLGFVVKAREPGEYPVFLVVVTEEGDGFPKEPLKVIVE